MTQAGNTLTLSFGTIAAGATATATVTVQIPGTARGSLSNTVTVTGTGVTGGTLTDTEPTALTPNYDVTVVQTVTPTSVAPGGQVTFTAVISNSATSISTASGVTVTDVLPAGLTLANASLNGTPITSLVNIAIPDLAPERTQHCKWLPTWVPERPMVRSSATRQTSSPPQARRMC